MFRGTVRGLAVAVALAMATVACSQSDPGITTAVKSKFAADDTVKAYRIDVDTKDRVVTLSGEVDNAAAKARAVELARAVDGVRDVVDKTAIVAGVTPPGGIDDQAAATTGKVARDADAKIDEAQKKADDKTDRAQKKASDATQSAGDATKDAALTAAVKTKFLADTKISGLKIDVDTQNGVVTLSGTVPTAAERTRAVNTAKETDGVKSVVNHLKVGKAGS
jgi:hyperosmotically inducible periplasmic protein